MKYKSVKLAAEYTKQELNKGITKVSNNLNTFSSVQNSSISNKEKYLLSKTKSVHILNKVLSKTHNIFPDLKVAKLCKDKSLQFLNEVNFKNNQVLTKSDKVLNIKGILTNKNDLLIKRESNSCFINTNYNNCIGKVYSIKNKVDKENRLKTATSRLHK